MSIRLSGMVSGLDTDSIVEELVSGLTTKKENIEKDQTKLEWKQEAWKTLNAKIYDLYSDTVSNLRYTTSFNKKTTSVSDSTKASVVATSSSITGTQTLSVTQLAKSGYLTGEQLSTDSSFTSSSTLTDLGAALSGSTSITLNVGGTDTSIDISDTTTISDVVSQLKAAGVNASFDATNQRLFVSSTSSGEAADFTLTSTGSADSDAALAALGLDYTSGSAIKVDGQDASITLNGADYTSSSNSFTINGLTITALEVTDNEISISTATDTSGIYDMIKNFITEYDALINEMDSLYNATSASKYEPLTDDEKESMSDDEIEKWETKIKDSLLRRDDTLSSVSQAMKSAMASTYDVNGSTYSLSNFGINTLSYFLSDDNEKSAYHIDGNEDDADTSGNDDQLMTAITTDPETVTSFFTQLAKGLYSSIDTKMKSTTLSSAYTVYNDKEMDSDYNDYDDKISDMEDKISDMEDYYYAKFAAMETALSKLESSTSALSSLLGS